MTILMSPCRQRVTSFELVAAACVKPRLGESARAFGLLVVGRELDELDARDAAIAVGHAPAAVDASAGSARRTWSIR